MRLWNRTREQMGPEAREIFAKEPPLDEAARLVLNVWGDLVTTRPPGFGVEGRIPWTACRDWGIEHDLDAEERRLIWTVIQRLDIEDLERRAFEAKARSGGK